MTGSEWIGYAAVQLAVLAALGTLGGWLAGRLGTARIAGAVLAGLLVGPAVLGRAAPDWHGALFGGSAPAQVELREYQTERAAARERLVDTGVTDVAVEAFDAETERRLAALRAEAREAGEPARRAGLIAAMVAVGIALFGCGWLAIGGGLDPPWRENPPNEPIGLMSLLTPAALAAFAGWALIRTHWVMLAGQDTTLWLAGMALGCGAAAVPPGAKLLAWVGGDRAGDEAAALRRSVRKIAWSNGRTALFALAALLLFGWATPEQPAAFGGAMHDWLGVIALGALALGAIVAWLVMKARRSGERTEVPPREPWRVVPMEGLLFALAGSRVALFSEFDWLLVLVVLVLCGDCKSLGVMVGAKLFAHRGWLEGMRMGTVIAAGGAVPVAVALLLREGGVIDGTLFTALVIASTLTAVLSRSMMRMIDQWLTEEGEKAE